MELRIRVGAAIDRSMSEAFRPLVKAAEQARAAIENSSKKTSSTTSKNTTKAANEEARAWAKTTREIERLEREKVRLAERSAAARAKASEAASRAETQAAQKAARERERIEARERAATERSARARAREELAIIREVDRAMGAGRARGGAAPRRGRGIAGARSDTRLLNLDANLNAATALGGRAARAATGLAADVAQGMGVNFDVASHVSNGVQLEKAATDLSNAGYMPGKGGPNGMRQDPAEIIKQMRAVGDSAAIDPTKAIEGLQKFVAKTGDLQTGRDLMADIAKYARASGAELDDMVDAAGDVKNALGADGGPEQVKAVMRAIAAQGKEGAVEIKDLATQMAKLSAASSTFTGDKGFVMAEMGALAQMTRAKGGAASATQAATSVQSFTNTFSKGARLDALKAFGVDFRGADNKVDVKKAIVNSIRAAAAAEHGGMANFDRNMGKMFMDVRARSVTKGFETTYKEAGGGEAGLKAVERALDDLTNATMNEKEVNDSFAASMKTTEAQVQQFNNEMAKTADELRSTLLPAFKGIAPLVIDLSKGLVDLLGGDEFKRQKADKAAFEAGARAMNATSAMRAAGEKGSIDDAEAQKLAADAMEAKKALQTAINAKAADLGEQRKKFELGLGHSMTDEEIAHEAKSPGDGGDDARRFLRDKEQLTSMKDSLERLTRGQDDLAEKLSQKTLKVILVGDTRAPTLTLDAIGRTDPPEKKRR